MNEIPYKLNFEKLCSELELGDLIGTPTAISGGLLHRTYALVTSLDKYAVKALNPQIMLRPEAVTNYRQSERIANKLAGTIAAQPAMIFNGNAVHHIEDQYYLVFQWIDGQTFQSMDITPLHCEQIGTILGQIHRTDCSSILDTSLQPAKQLEIDWNGYVKRGLHENIEWAPLLENHAHKLYEWTAKANTASTILSVDQVISHRDLEPKNVMCRHNKPIIIDWESAGRINPLHDLVETAIYWSVLDTGIVSQVKFMAFVRAYRKQAGEPKVDWGMVLNHGYEGKLAWLEYSLKRSLKIECTDQAEQQLGTSQVSGTLDSLQRYENMSGEIEGWLNA
ncbi:aminoglycoside phosphotransferase (APT) family kinase protein [Paenibacillus amylolyticus]|uniref:Aminoglycoside phosphotransferase (APT) family kinase protein n=1 Tax=Paenibacillus amylolyticus TaxID=1451 RepID=A0AAP5LTW2_PAEAM|nr:aminoglycoside phosphotransferase family protein [Paenibacillus amylolyticus]MDR6726979.1 aminoglycoside phosphotransferase (APT) family kinase protein [Paenibacillus amylolyticus]